MSCTTSKSRTIAFGSGNWTCAVDEPSRSTHGYRRQIERRTGRSGRHLDLTHLSDNRDLTSLGRSRRPAIQPSTSSAVRHGGQTQARSAAGLEAPTRAAPKNPVESDVVSVVRALRVNQLCDRFADVSGCRPIVWSRLTTPDRAGPRRLRSSISACTATDGLPVRTVGDRHARRLDRRNPAESATLCIAPTCSAAAAEREPERRKPLAQQLLG